MANFKMRAFDPRLGRPGVTFHAVPVLWQLKRKSQAVDMRRERPRSWLDTLNRDFLSILCGRHLLIDAQQLPQFQFGSKQVLESVLIQFLKKSLDRFRHCRAQCATGCDPAVALRILAFDHREVRFDFADDFPHHNPAWRLSQAQPSVAATNGFKVPCVPELIRYFHQMVF